MTTNTLHATIYTISARTSGLDLGVYAASSPREAIEAMHVAAGYASTQDAATQLDTTVEALLADLVVVGLDAEFRAQFASVIDAEGFEAECLSIGSEFLPPCAVAVRDGGEATAEYYQWLIGQCPALDLAAVHQIGRECCEFWTGYLDQPGVSTDPNDWTLSALDIETAAAELGVPATPALIAALEAGFSERRGELAHAATTWILSTDDDCETSEIEAEDFDAAREALVEWVGDNYSPESKTYWVRAYATSPSGVRTFVRVEVAPEEPDCFESDHAWIDGPIYGSGGGVCYRQTCEECGQVRRIDTWASDPQDGSQGHSSVEYLPAD